MIYKTRKVLHGYTEIITYAVDDLHDGISFYRRGDFITDDSYFHFQCECTGWNDEQIDKLMSALAKIYGCEYSNKELTNTNKNHDEGLTMMVQCATAICTIIFTARDKTMQYMIKDLMN